MYSNTFGHQFAFFGDLADFGNGWIVDPWANIACQGKDYEQQLTTQMSAWETKGKEIIGPVRNILNEGWHDWMWVKPTDPRVKGILTNPKGFWSKNANDVPAWDANA